MTDTVSNGHAAEPSQEDGCPHLRFHSEVAVARLTRSQEDDTVVAYAADIKIRCIDCGESFCFVGVEKGLSPHQPMVSPDNEELRIPLRPSSQDQDYQYLHNKGPS